MRSIDVAGSAARRLPRNIGVCYDGEYKANMARRPELDIPMTREELAALQKQFKTMSESAIQSFYHGAYRRCQFVNRAPTARSIQELVAVWKYMRS